MNDYLLYDLATGRPLAQYRGAYPFLQTQVGRAVIAGFADQSTSYVHQGEILDRPINPTISDKLTLTADGTDRVTFSNIPLGTFTATHRESGESTSGPIQGNDTFAANMPGRYDVVIEAWPYLDYKVSIDAI